MVPAVPQWSTSWRLAGHMRVGLDDFYLVEGDDTGRRVSSTNCRLDESSNLICMVDGQRVAYWTGPKPGFVESALGHTVGGDKVAD